jgi:hypothetical protein
MPVPSSVTLGLMPSEALAKEGDEIKGDNGDRHLFLAAIMGTGTYFLRRYGGMVESDIAVSLSRHIIRTLGKREWNVAGLHIAIVHGTNARRLQK